MCDKSTRRRTVTLFLFVVILGPLLLSSAFHSRAQDDESVVAATMTPTDTPTPLPAFPTSQIIPKPEGVHIRNHTQLCWQRSPFVRYYDFYPQNYQSIEYTGVPKGIPIDLICHEFYPISSEVEQLCVRVFDLLKTSEWVCVRRDSPPATPAIAPEIEPPHVWVRFIDQVTHLCWAEEYPEGVAYFNYIGFIHHTVDSHDPILVNEIQYRLGSVPGEDCIVYFEARPGSQLCLYVDGFGERSSICKEVPGGLPPPTPLPSPTPTATPSGG